MTLDDLPPHRLICREPQQPWRIFLLLDRSKFNSSQPLSIAVYETGMAADGAPSGGGLSAKQQQTPPPIDPQTVQERLLTREGGGSAPRGSLLRCAHLYREFTSKALAMAAAPDAADAEAAEALGWAKAALQRELKLHALDVRKVAIGVAGSAQAEMEAHAAAGQRMDGRIADVRSEIAELRTQLRAERAVRANREECDGLAKMALAHPPRRVTEVAAGKVAHDMAAVLTEDRRLSAELGVRARQYSLLVAALQDMSQTVAEDEVRAEEVAQQQQDIALDADSGIDGALERMDTSPLP